MAEFHIRPLTFDDDLDTFGRIVLDSYLALADMPREPDYEAELVDVAARVRDGVVFGAFVGCLAEAEAIGSDAVFIYTGSWMHTAHRLYRRLGFEFVPERDWHVDPGIHLLGMRRPL